MVSQQHLSDGTIVVDDDVVLDEIVVVVTEVVLVLVIVETLVVVLVVEQGQSLMQAPLNWHVDMLKQPRPFIVSQQQLPPDTVVLAPEHVPKQHFMLVF